MSGFATEMLPNSRDVTITRVFDASPEMLWRMYTDPKHLVEFYGSPGCTHPVCEIDLRVGGVWNHVLRVPDGREYPSKSTFTVVERPRRLSYDWQALPAEAYGDVLPPPMTNDYVFEPEGSGCRLTITVTFTSAEMRDGLARSGFLSGIEASMARLDDHLAGRQGSAGNAPARRSDPSAGGVSSIDKKKIMAGVIPYLSLARDTEDAISFYEKAFEAVLVGEPARDPAGVILNATLAINGGALMLMDHPDGIDATPAKGGQGVTLQLVVANGDAWWSRAVDAGCEITEPFELKFWGDRYGRLRDPFGQDWAIVEPSAARRGEI